MRTNRRVATNPDERKPVSVSLDEESVRKIRGKQKRKKQALPGLQRQRIGVRNPTMENGILNRDHRVFLQQVKGCGSVNRPTPGSQRPAEPVASGFFGGSNRAEKCGSVKEPWRQAVGRGCQIFPERSHSVRCHNRGWRVFLLSAGQAERLAVRQAHLSGAKPRDPIV